MGVVHLVMLAGLAGVLAPLLIHLLRRRRPVPLDWGAMQFLDASETSRSRRRIDDFLLLLLRIGAVAILAFALAGPFAEGTWLSFLADRPPREIVLVIDGSYSMTVGPNCPYDQARTWLDELLGRLHSGDRVGILRADAAPTTIIEPSADHDAVRQAFDAAPRPDGNVDWPRALETALKLPGEVLVLRDQQKVGWADAETLATWRSLATSERKIHVVEFAPTLPAEIDNRWLKRLTANRAVAFPGQRVVFKSSLHQTIKSMAPAKLRYRIDGQDAGSVASDAVAFSHRFTEAGSHLVTLVIEDPDLIEADNTQHLAIEILVGLPVLLVESDTKASPEGSTFFLSRALGENPEGQGTKPSVVLASALDAKALKDIRVVILADAAILTPSQIGALDAFVRSGGGLVIAPGPRMEKVAKAIETPWMPAKIAGYTGDPDQLERAAHPDGARLNHPALGVFQTETTSTLGQIKFPRWAKLEPREGATILGSLTSFDPWIIEKSHGKGRVVMLSTPLDRSWKSTFPGGWEFPVFVHELVLHLAGGAASDTRLSPGQAIRFDPPERPTQITFTAPGIKPETFAPKEWPWLSPSATRTGVYRVNQDVFVLPLDPRESDLTPANESEKKQLAAVLNVAEGRPDAMLDRVASTRQDLGSLFLLVLLTLLVGEVWYTRRLQRGAS